MLDTLALELQMIVNQHVGDRNHQGPLQEHLALLTAEHDSNPDTHIFLTILGL